MISFTILSTDGHGAKSAQYVSSWNIIEKQCFVAFWIHSHCSFSFRNTHFKQMLCQSGERLIWSNLFRFSRFFGVSFSFKTEIDQHIWTKYEKERRFCTFYSLHNLFLSFWVYTWNAVYIILIFFSFIFCLFVTPQVKSEYFIHLTNFLEFIIILIHLKIWVKIVYKLHYACRIQFKTEQRKKHCKFLFNVKDKSERVIQLCHIWNDDDVPLICRQNESDFDVLWC